LVPTKGTTQHHNPETPAKTYNIIRNPYLSNLFLKGKRSVRNTAGNVAEEIVAGRMSEDGWQGIESYYNLVCRSKGEIIRRRWKGDFKNGVEALKCSTGYVKRRLVMFPMKSNGRSGRHHCFPYNAYIYLNVVTAATTWNWNCSYILRG
jgi:hypothetical protein